MTSRAPSASRVAQYAAEAAAAQDVNPEARMGRGRTVAVVRARVALWKRLSDDGFSLYAIGQAVGRHHTTVMHALRKDA
jgi:chromosomal replication initiation ATPase DnaA